MVMNMKKKNRSHASGMPMLEMVITIGIFTIISAFVLKLFVSADSLKTRAAETGKAVMCAENAAEAIKGSKSIDEAALLLGLREKDGGYVGYYNSKWEVVESADSYSLIINPIVASQGNGIMISADISVKRLDENGWSKDNDGILYSLQVKHYVPAD